MGGRNKNKNMNLVPAAAAAIDTAEAAPAAAPAAAAPATVEAAPAPAAPAGPEISDEIRAALIAAGWRAPGAKKAKAPAGPKKVSALDAAAMVLTESAEPMGAKALIAAMAERNLWQSPGGATPDATLAAAIVREIATKTDKARFIKVAPGMWIARAENAA